MDQDTRNALRNAVTACRRVLEDDVRAQLEGAHGIRPDGTIEAAEGMAGLRRDPQLAEARQRLESGVRHLIASGATPAQAVERFAREVAFTYLNRLAALKMMEARELIAPSVGAGPRSRGFSDFAQVAPAICRAAPDGGYRRYLELLFDEITAEVRVLFDRRLPTSALFPRPDALVKVLDELNDPALARVWAADETIGWVYQYFTPEEQRREARAASQAPRNSYELSFRNQFYTPDYVVRFLADNTLGRLWYEMRQGVTSLVETCQYMVRRKHTVFLAEGTMIPAPYDLTAKLHYREDPGELWTRPNTALLDLRDQWQQVEALWSYALTINGYAYAEHYLGGAHDTAYCAEVLDRHESTYRRTGRWQGTFEELRLCLFTKQRQYRWWQEVPEGDALAMLLDLYRAILERWDLETEFIPYRQPRDPRTITVLDPAVGSAHFLLYAFDLLATTYGEAEPDLPTAAIPALILEHNLYGIDIDPRAVQIASLALYLKARKYDRTAAIRNANIVLAAPMPGERALFSGFLADLNSPTLARIAEAMWDELKLAGEMGSLLKPEVRLREVVTEQRRQQQRQSAVRQQVLLPEFEQPRQGELDFSDVTDDRFWDEAAERILAVLRDYAEQARDADATTRRLFAGDSEQGFRFVDLLRTHYDVVLMNPPFGEAVPSVKPMLEKAYPHSKNDLYATFVERGLDLLCQGGRLGAITSRTGFFLTSFKEWRQEVVLTGTRIEAVADLGYGVLDKAMVETAAYTLRRNTWQEVEANASVFAHLLKRAAKNVALHAALANLHTGTPDSHLHMVQQETFRLIPGAPFPYWAGAHLVHTFAALPALEHEGRIARLGVNTTDDFRFLRLWWEVGLAALHKRWFPIFKGGGYAPFYRGTELVVDWEDQGSRLKAYIVSRGDSPSRNVRSEALYFRCGLTYSSRTQKGLAFQPLTRGSLFTVKGPGIFAASDQDLPALLGLINSSVFRSLVALQMAFGSYEVGVIQRTPVPKLTNLQGQLLGAAAMSCVDLKRSLDTANEISCAFHSSALMQVVGNNLKTRSAIWLDQVAAAHGEYEILQQQIDHLSTSLYGIENEDDNVVNESIAIGGRSASEGAEEDNGDSEADNPQENFHWTSFVDDLLSYCIGVVFGRWDARIGKDPALATCLGGAFEALPICSPGMLTEDARLLGTSSGPLPYQPERLPASPGHLPADYPLPIQWSGILPDDEGHPDDLVARVREVLAYLFGAEAAPAIEAEAIGILQAGGRTPRDLRDYYATRFLATHIKRYSKSRRKAPIYWQLASRRKGYSLWLYYHRLGPSTLYQALQDYVEPKTELERARLRELEAQQRSASDARAARALAGQVEKKATLVDELVQFGIDLKEAADRGFEPDLNDGVRLNIAPLHKIVPWPEAATAWRELKAGKYPWSTIGQRLARDTR